jgi:tRNA nucleotidyltransferase (CCA-adding enzyme)
MKPKIYKEYMTLSYGTSFVLKLLHTYGYEAYVVGGACRDYFLGKEPKDYDICSNATPEQMQEIALKENIRLIETGLQHGTVTFHLGDENIEVTTYRIDGEYENHRRPVEVEFVQEVVKDLSRRDFTFNALLYEPNVGFLDYFNGVEDLKNHVVRCIGKPEERFREDALRIMRAIRFASRLNFCIEENTAKAIKKCSHLLKHISKERIQMELNQILSSGYSGVQNIMNYYSVFFENVFGCHFFDYIHHSYNNQIHSITDISVNLTLFFFYLGENDIEKLLRKLKYDNQTIKEVIGISRAYRDFVHIYSIWNNELDYIKTVRFLKKDYGANIVKKLWNFVATVRELPSYYWQGLEIIEDKKMCCSLKELAINGNDLLALGIQGQDIKKLLNYSLEQVILEEVENTKDELLKTMDYSIIGGK